MGSLVIQAAPNVGQGYYDWGSNYPDVVNVGAWDVDPSESSARQRFHHRDRGYCWGRVRVERVLGSNFGTSFATPAVTAEVLNLLNSALINMNSSGETLPDEPSDEPVDIDYTELVDTLDYIGTTYTST